MLREQVEFLKRVEAKSLVEDVCVLRCYSTMNQWIDFIVVVPNLLRETAKELIANAVDRFFDEDNQTPYGELVQNTLDKYNMKYDLLLGSMDEEADETDKDWTETINQLHSLRLKCGFPMQTIII